MPRWPSTALNVTDSEKSAMPHGIGTPSHTVFPFNVQIDVHWFDEHTTIRFAPFLAGGFERSQGF